MESPSMMPWPYDSDEQDNGDLALRVAGGVGGLLFFWILGIFLAVALEQNWPFFVCVAVGVVIGVLLFWFVK
jgi:hypothetical protein